VTKIKKNKTTKISEKEHKEISLLYQNAAVNLAQLKKSQWQVVVFYSAIVAFLVTQSDKLTHLIKTWVSIALLFGAIAVVIAQMLFREKMHQERTVLNNIYEMFEQPFKDCRKPKGDVKTFDTFENIFIVVVVIYVVAVFIFAVSIFGINFY
jgi:Sec-independent protein secretion pathway component TatC